MAPPPPPTSAPLLAHIVSLDRSVDLDLQHLIDRSIDFGSKSMQSVLAIDRSIDFGSNQIHAISFGDQSIDSIQST
jgi:hypothetical protein